MTSPRNVRSRYVAESRALIAEYAESLRRRLARDNPEYYEAVKDVPTTGSRRSRYIAESKVLIRASLRRRLARSEEIALRRASWRREFRATDGFQRPAPHVDEVAAEEMVKREDITVAEGGLTDDPAMTANEREAWVRYAFANWLDIEARKIPDSIHRVAFKEGYAAGYHQSVALTDENSTTTLKERSA